MAFSQPPPTCPPRGTGGCVPSPSGFVLRIAPARCILPTLWCRVAPLLPAGWAIPAKSSGRWTAKEADMAAEFTRFSETILTKQDQRVVSITVKPMISDCTGRIYFTDLMVQEGDRLTGYVINTETILQKYREDGSIVPPRFYNGVVRSAGNGGAVQPRLRYGGAGLLSLPGAGHGGGQHFRGFRARAHTRQLSLLR